MSGSVDGQRSRSSQGSRDLRLRLERTAFLPSHAKNYPNAQDLQSLHVMPSE